MIHAPAYITTRGADRHCQVQVRGCERHPSPLSSRAGRDRHDLPILRHVDRRRRLVAQQQLRIKRSARRDHHWFHTSIPPDSSVRALPQWCFTGSRQAPTPRAALQARRRARRPPCFWIRRMASFRKSPIRRTGFITPGAAILNITDASAGFAPSAPPGRPRRPRSVPPTRQTRTRQPPRRAGTAPRRPSGHRLARAGLRRRANSASPAATRS